MKRRRIRGLERIGDAAHLSHSSLGDRVMNGKHELCRLCQSEGPLRFSHILPEFLYKRLYDDKHRCIGIKATAEEPGANQDFLQKGIREYLLCGDCEQHLAGYERYAAGVLRELPDMTSEPAGAVVRVTGIDYSLFKLFQLSLLWRAGISNHASFQGVYLGPHEPRLRDMIREGDPGDPLDYGCMLIRTRGPETLDHFIKPPTHMRFGGHHGYQMILAGMIWTYVVSSHSDQIHEKGSFLATNGILPIHIATVTVGEFIAGVGQALRNEGYYRLGGAPDCSSGPESSASWPLSSNSAGRRQ